MTFSPLLLSLATPAAVATASTVVDVAQGLGQNFANLLSGASGSVAAEASSADRESKAPSSLADLAGELRQWFRELGLEEQPFQLNFDLTADGTQSLSVTGMQADRLNEELENAPEWGERMRAFASNLQHAASQSMGGSVPHLRLSITESESTVSQS